MNFVQALSQQNRKPIQIVSSTQKHVQLLPSLDTQLKLLGFSTADSNCKDLAMVHEYLGAYFGFLSVTTVLPDYFSLASHIFTIHISNMYMQFYSKEQVTHVACLMLKNFLLSLEISWTRMISDKVNRSKSCTFLCSSLHILNKAVFIF